MSTPRFATFIRGFSAKAGARERFKEAYAALEIKCQVIDQLFTARTRAGLAQDAVAEQMETTKSVVSCLEGTETHAPSLGTLRRYA